MPAAWMRFLFFCSDEVGEEELQTSAAAVTDLLKRNFKAHFAKKTPFGVYVHHSWFSEFPVRKEGFRK